MQPSPNSRSTCWQINWLTTNVKTSMLAEYTHYSIVFCDFFFLFSQEDEKKFDWNCMFDIVKLHITLYNVSIKTITRYFHFNQKSRLNWTVQPIKPHWFVTKINPIHWFSCTKMNIITRTTVGFRYSVVNFTSRADKSTFSPHKYCLDLVR